MHTQAVQRISHQMGNYPWCCILFDRLRKSMELTWVNIINDVALEILSSIIKENVWTCGILISFQDIFHTTHKKSWTCLPFSTTNALYLPTSPSALHAFFILFQSLLEILHGSVIPMPFRDVIFTALLSEDNVGKPFRITSLRDKSMYRGRCRLAPRQTMKQGVFFWNVGVVAPK